MWIGVRVGFTLLCDRPAAKGRCLLEWTDTPAEFTRERERERDTGLTGTRHDD